MRRWKKGKGTCIVKDGKHKVLCYLLIGFVCISRRKAGQSWHGRDMQGMSSGFAQPLAYEGRMLSPVIPISLSNSLPVKTSGISAVCRRSFFGIADVPSLIYGRSSNLYGLSKSIKTTLLVLPALGSTILSHSNVVGNEVLKVNPSQRMSHIHQACPEVLRASELFKVY